MKEKLKSFLENDRYFYGFLVILVGAVSFFLGQKSVLPPVNENPDRVMSIEEVGLERGEVNPATVIKQRIIASKSGTKFHLENCPGARTIKPENRLVFKTIAEAKAAGYTPAENCPGLE